MNIRKSKTRRLHHTSPANLGQIPRGSGYHPVPSNVPEASPFQIHGDSKTPLQPQSQAKELPNSAFESASARDMVQQASQQQPDLQNANSYTSSGTITPPSEVSSYGELLNQALEFTHHPNNSVPIQPTPLTKPIVLPQIRKGRTQAFFRAWAPGLQSKGITQSDFLSFIDNLNVVATKSPPLQIVDLAGGIIALVPHAWFNVAGLAVSISAKLGAAAVSKGRTELYLREVNKKLFGPRGLKVSIASTLATREILKVPGSLPKLASLSDETFYINTAERALRAVAPYSAHLELDVPPPTEQSTMLAKVSAKEAASKDRKNHKKVMKKRDKAGYKAEKRERKRERKEAKRVRKGKLPRKVVEVEESEDSGSSTSSSDSEDERDVAQTRSKDANGNIKLKKDKEEKRVRKLLWIVIENI